ncbi:MAG TPA: ankyrin repeat domain-containing protein [Puia sp.]|nr:ankyrin repeat domain-containing protein [Puia sp.]
MKNTDIKDPIFLQAVEAIDSGNVSLLQNLIEKYPRLISERLHYPEQGYFMKPYLLWFVADNPIRIDKLPDNIVAITKLLIKALKQSNTITIQEQLDYTLGLVVSGRIPKECGVQIDLMDLLIDEGAHVGDDAIVLAHGNIEAAKHLITKGSRLTLPIAVGLDKMKDVEDLLPLSNEDEKLTALAIAGFYGKTSIISALLKNSANPNGYPKKESGFHSHATPLHQAVFSGDLNAVKLLVDAGASLNARDKIYDGTPLDWAEYMPREENQTKEAINNYKKIAAYLRSKQKSN